MAESLEKYRNKRRFNQTPEPDAAGSVSGSGHSFVIHEHHARRLHFDLRLEMNGVLKSWAVPKGPSLDPHDKRLAVQTEDHPLDYLTFEGTIPEGNYGAGEVAVWDIGSYEMVDSQDFEEGISKGKLSFKLKGNRLCGEFHLVRTGQTKDSWLLMKRQDECANAGWRIETILDTEPGIAEVANVVVDGARKQTVKVDIGEIAPFPAKIEPMLATPVDAPFDDPRWLFEVKWDGYRSLCYVEGEHIRFLSRNHLDLGEKLPDLVAARAEIAAQTAVIDGEILALNPEGKPDFQLLQNAAGFRPGPHRPEKPVLIFYAFDLLYCNGRDLSNEPLLHRKQLLAQLINGQGRIRFSDHVEGKGKLLFEQVREQGMEGIIAKDGQSKYEQRRSKRWLKIKLAQTIDAVIGGYTAGRGSRSHFGALILGLYDGSTLQYLGNVGGGFSENGLQQLHARMQALRTDTSPFATDPKTEEKAQWLRPELVCEVRFTEMTVDGKLRHPIFLRMRDDKDPRTCTLTGQEPLLVEKAAPSLKVVRSAGGGQTSAPAEEFFATEPLHGNHSVVVDGHDLALTNLEKVYWPDDGLTKGDFLRYSYQIADVLLPHLKDRPLILKRYPDGINGEAFYQHHVEDAPSFVETWTSPPNDKGERVTYALCNNKASLVYLANLGAVQISPWHSRHMTSSYPDWVVLDLDPSADAAYKAICRLALLIRDILQGLGVQSYAKTSGSRGIHVYIPLEPVYAHEQVTAFAEVVARIAQAQSPQDSTVERMTKKRPARSVYIDYLQNGLGKTLVGVYTARARAGATVSAPLSWEEVERCVPLTEFTIKTMIKRIDEVGDLFRPVLTVKQGLHHALEKLQAG
jgi:bifunctional non-homologous end joining protein LigD